MPATNHYRFFLLRYVPDLVNEEFVNLGLVLLSGETPGEAGGATAPQFARVKFTHDWRRLKCLDSDIDMEMLHALENELAARLGDLQDREGLLLSLHDKFSNTLQLSETRVSLGESPEKEIEVLAKMYLDPPARQKSSRAQAARHAIYQRMREAFAAEGVWQSDLLRKRIPVAQYTRPGDPLKIDCGYRPNGIIRLFHGVSLQADPDAAKVLAFSYPQIKDGIARAENAETDLTAVIEDDLVETDAAVAFALHTLVQNRINVARLADLNAIAARARLELHI